MGGVNKSENFILNVRGWDELYEKSSAKQEIEEVAVFESHLGIAPVTGAVENMGFQKEADFYFPYLKAASEAKILVCAGDGYPDEKLLLSVEAARKLGVKIHFFLKPYPASVLTRRVEWVKNHALSIGIDIDAYNILTMREKVKLEKKNGSDLISLRKETKLPLTIKGIFSEEDIKLCEEVLPEVAIISNHGGRIERGRGSTAFFLEKHIERLKRFAGEVWVDGGIRKKRDVKTALFYKASRVLLGRPFITAFMKSGENGVKALSQTLLR